MTQYTLLTTILVVLVEHLPPRLLAALEVAYTILAIPRPRLSTVLDMAHRISAVIVVPGLVAEQRENSDIIVTTTRRNQLPITRCASMDLIILVTLELTTLPPPATKTGQGSTRPATITFQILTNTAV